MGRGGVVVGGDGGGEEMIDTEKIRVSAVYGKAVYFDGLKTKL